MDAQPLPPPGRPAVPRRPRPTAPPVAVEHELLDGRRRDRRCGADRPGPGGDRAARAYAAYARVRAGRTGRAEPAAARPTRRPWSAGSRADLAALRGRLRRGRRPPGGAPGRHPARGRRTPAARLAAVRRHAAPLRLDRPGRPPDDAPDGVDPGLPGLVARRGRAGAVAAAQPGRPVPGGGLRRRRRPGPRLATWLAVDPRRTAFDDRLLRGDDPVGGVRRLRRRRHRRSSTPGVDQHLTTLFPPVRPRGRYLEVRFPDVQDDDADRHAGDGARHPAVRRRPAARRPCDAGGRRSRGSAEHWDDAAHGTRRRRRPGPRARRADRRPCRRVVAGVTRPVRRRPAGRPAGRDRRQHRADGGHPGARRRGVGLRPRGPRRRRRSGAPRGPSGIRLAATAPRERPPLGRRADLVRRRSSGARSTWPPTSTSSCCGSTRRSTRATCTRRTCSTSSRPAAAGSPTGPPASGRCTRSSSPCGSRTCAPRPW